MILTESKFASESGHWYTKAGESAYDCIGNNGQKRHTTLRDARKLGLCPSVTTIIKCAAAPGLEVWRQQQMMLSALTLPRADGETEADWLARVVVDSKETGRKAADRGTEIHGAIECYFQGERPREYEPHARAANEAIGDHFGEMSWKAEKSFAHPMGFGGKVDLHSEHAVCDFKTKEFGQDDDLKTWPEHRMQLAAYRVGLGIPSARCAIVYVSASEPGLARVMEIPEKELALGWRCFVALLEFWKARNEFEPGWNA